MIYISAAEKKPSKLKYSFPSIRAQIEWKNSKNERSRGTYEVGNFICFAVKH